MSDCLQVKRGTLAQLKTHTPAEGEPVWATDLKKLYVGDGTTPLGKPIQPFLSSPMTLYVTPSGNATGSGLSWDQSLTLPAAITRASAYGWSKLGDMTIQVGTGSYTLNAPLPTWQAAPLRVIGSVSNPALTTITTTYDHAWRGTFDAEQGGMMLVDGFRFATTAAADANNRQRALVAHMDGSMLIGRVSFTGNWDTYLLSVEHSYIETLGKNIDSTGWVRTAMINVDGHSTAIISVPTWTLTSTPTVNTAVYGVLGSSVMFTGNTMFTGTSNTTYKAILAGFSSIRLNGTTLPGPSYYTTSNLTGAL